MARIRSMNISQKIFFGIYLTENQIKLSFIIHKLLSHYLSISNDYFIFLLSLSKMENFSAMRIKKTYFNIFLLKGNF